MAPTETLAEQHFLTLDELCRSLGVTCGLLTSSVGKRARDAAAGAAILVGTHALIQEGVDLANVAVAGRRRAAPLRRRAARGACRRRSPARPAHDGDADPADARADRLRRPLGERDREAARVAEADRHAWIPRSSGARRRTGA
jgi:hypothetical protein